MNSHFMEFPRAILLENGIIKKTGDFMTKPYRIRKLLIVSDSIVKKSYGT